MPSIEVIIVNWNAGVALRECLESIASSSHEGFTLSAVTVVDNASSDGSAKQLSGLSLPLKIIENSRNRGFAAACNQGAKGSAADYLLFLNPDTRVYEDTLPKSVQFMADKKNSAIGILGVQLVDDRGAVSRSCARFFTLGHFFNHMLGLSRLFPRHFHDAPMLEWDHLQSQRVDHVIGAYFFVRNSAFKQLLGFDERFFVYLEDIDFTLRAKRVGWATYFLADAHCYHQGGGTSGQIKPRRLYYSLQSRILYGFKNLGPLPGFVLLLATLFLEPLSRMAEALVRLSPQRASETVQGYYLLWRAMPQILARSQERADHPIGIQEGM